MPWVHPWLAIVAVIGAGGDGIFVVGGLTESVEGASLRSNCSTRSRIFTRFGLIVNLFRIETRRRKSSTTEAKIVCGGC